MNSLILTTVILLAPVGEPPQAPPLRAEPAQAPAVKVCVCGPACPKGGCDACACPKPVALPEWRWEALPGVGMGRVHKSVPSVGPWTADRPAEEPARPKAPPGTESPSIPTTNVQSVVVPSSSSTGFYRPANTFMYALPGTPGGTNCVGNA